MGGERWREPERAGRRALAAVLIGGFAVSALLVGVVVIGERQGRPKVSTAAAAPSSASATFGVIEASPSSPGPATGAQQAPTEALPQTGVAAPTTTTNLAQSPSWADEGERFKSSFAEQVKDGLVMSMYPVESFANAGEWAFQSAAVDIVGPGVYDLRFAVPDGFVVRNYGLQMPPDFLGAWSSVPSASANSFGESGMAAGPDGFIHIDLLVPDTGQPVNYPALTVWMH